jgi:hypothetical protein
MWGRATRPDQEKNSRIWQNEAKIPNVFNATVGLSSEEEMNLFDVLLQFQSAQQQPGTKQSNLIRASIRRLRQALGAGQTTSATEPETSEVSRQLALSFLQRCDDNEGPF